MNTTRIHKHAAVLTVLAAFAISAALAGGPLEIFDPSTKTPYAWQGGTIPVYTDTGSLGILSNEQADAMVAFAISQWNAVPTATVHSAVAGDFASIGLPDITAANIFDVLGTWNGGGIHIVYDSDGSIHNALLGNPYVLGFTILEYGDPSNGALLEATIVINGAAIYSWLPPDQAAAMFAGVVTHEFGHALNLAHTQTNGQLYSYYDVYSGPEGCDTPYSGYVSPSQVETMYPFINLYGTGQAMSTVDQLDDIAALSDIYPAAGWPADFGSISGKIYAPGLQSPEEYTGANVIARNMADPFGNAISAISGDHTQGALGPEGGYAFHGLTPGASYAVYVDGILAGAFSTPVDTVLPGPEEFYNGPKESGNGITDDRCDVTPIEVSAGTDTLASVIFNRVKGAPVFTPIDLPNSTVADLSGDGSVAVGTWGGGIFRWTPQGDYELIGGSPFSPSPGISEDGTRIVGEITDETTWGKPVDVAAVWQGGETWAPIGTVPGNTPCDDDLISAWDVSSTGKVVGLSWQNCTNVSAYEWTASTGIHELGYLHDSSRANAVSDDGATIVGWDRHPTGFWRAARWDNGQESLIEMSTPAQCDNDPASDYFAWSNVGTAYGINADGTAMTGECYPIERTYSYGGTDYHYCDCGAWRWTQAGGVESLGDYQYPDFTPWADDISDSGEVIVGGANPLDPWGGGQRSAMWTPATGLVDFQEFLAVQGTWAPGWALAGISSVSGDGHTIAGGAYSPYSIQGYVVQIPKVVICHTTRGTRNRPGRKNTIDVTFPDGLADHLAHGDTIGLCGNGM
ncbi:MAG TPA: hypothetical protein VNI57_05660 [Candidatus Saccharimonadales bacterium]|nr:hypothetical protein [Candidatus Saccharimonadales bacterium]